MYLCGGGKTCNLIKMNLSPSDFLAQGSAFPIVDVRTPAEFATGHIPGAHNIPIFSDEERALVGTCYKKSGKEPAVELGLKLVGPKLFDLVKQAKNISRRKPVLIHCWRGGMRSASMAWLFTTAGIETRVLTGGYKSYRQYIRNEFDRATNILIVSGYTGSGKTDILKSLAKQGEQIIDLEGLARHKGSAFGAIGQEEQPTNEQFENNLAREWQKLDPGKRIWIEDESRAIGRIVIPENLFFKMRSATVLRVDIPRSVRVERLVKEYAHIDDSEIENALLKLKNKWSIGLTPLLEALTTGDYHKVANITLAYYDKAYLKGLGNRDPKTIINLPVDEDDPEQTACKLIDCAKSL